METLLIIMILVFVFSVAAIIANATKNKEINDSVYTMEDVIGVDTDDIYVNMIMDPAYSSVPGNIYYIDISDD